MCLSILVMIRVCFLFVFLNVLVMSKHNILLSEICISLYVHLKTIGNLIMQVGALR